MTPIELAPDYYLHNFRRLIDTVEQRYQDLLSDDESHWVVQFRGLTAEAQMLYVRLLSRKGEFFRLGKLSYPEIGDLACAARALADRGLIEWHQHTWPTEQLAALFTKPELLSRFPALSPFKQARKPQLVEALAARAPAPEDFGDDILRICHQQYLSTFLLLFFGNRHQDLSQFVLTDLGLHQFEAYPVDRNNRLFTARQQIEQWLMLSDLSDQYWQAKDRKDPEPIPALAQQIPATYDWPPLERRRQKLINLIARDLERAEHFDVALALFRQSELPPSRERQARILNKLGDPDSALTLARQMRQAPHNEEEADVAARLEKKLCRQLNHPFAPVPEPDITESHLQLAYTGQRVELAVAEYYTVQGWQVFYTENSLLCGLFGLAFWDIIFAPVPGAFLNPYQRAPRDMFQPEFTQQRQGQIQQRLQDIAQGRWQHWHRVYDAKYGLSNDWVNWPLLPPELLTLSTACFSGPLLARLFERILFDPRSNRAGLPDLILFQSGQYLWVEVKGPGDKLQSNQIRWLRTFAELNIPARVDYVRWNNNADEPDQP
ncbi:VRR-NUC domain-containing protein [Photobacterium sp. TY1-4]|uniref:VRR-NUC domain-containing protein n=1 Tax=Photobacterium sp. TY1-4 TaxID=2899122 RepID=UPI0021BEEC34|nr:VRR-NUC domain-containing protein [Photobacterium sp. TY1-4]UXI00186.1 VRR-NUC domain-containing protein [Photobacterium sp. TY1-4]